MLSSISRKIDTAGKIVTTFSPASLPEYLKYSRNIPGKPRGNGLLRLGNGLVFRVRPGTLDAYIVLEVFGRKVYARDADLLRGSRTILDIGAHIGTFTIQAASMCPSATVYSFEPVEGNHQLLRENLELNNIRNVRLFKNAVAGKEERRHFYVKSSNNSSRLSLLAGEKEENFRKAAIETTTLANVLRENGIKAVDFMKMDVEGAEYEILFSTPAEVLRKIRYLVMEWHTPAGQGPGVQGIAGFLRKNNFSVEYESYPGAVSGILYARNLGL